MSYKEISLREFKKILIKNSYSFIRQTGGHLIYHSDTGRQLVINARPKQLTMIHLIKEYQLAW